MATLSFSGILLEQYVGEKSDNAILRFVDLDSGSMLQVSLQKAQLSADAAADRTPHKFVLIGFKTQMGSKGAYNTITAVHDADAIAAAQNGRVPAKPVTA